MIFLYILAGIVVLLLVLAAVAPKSYDVSRSVTIQKPRAEVYDYLKYIKNQDHWAPWNQFDADMERKFTGEDGEIGFISFWDSDHKKVGSGEQEIKVLKPNERIESELRFLKPWKSTSMGYFDLKDAGENGTQVSWGFYGRHKAPMNVMMLFFNMEKAVGKDFESGLSELKKVLES